MKKTKWLLSLIFIGLIFGFVSCSDDINDHTNTTENTLSKGFFILCEGNWGHNNSTLDFYDVESQKITLDIFNSVNGQSLGDTGNDMIEFGDYIFIAVKGSACIHVINKNTGKLIKRIPVIDSEGTNRKPSRFCATNSMIYLCTVDGNVIEINPNSLSLGRIVKVGRNPEDICISNNKLYVTNSGGLDYNTPIGYDKTVSVVNPSSMTEIKKIEVGFNPGFIKPLKDGLVGLIVKGDYSDIKFVTINTNTDGVNKIYNIPMLNFDVIDNNNIVYLNYDYFGSSTSVIKKFDYNSNTTSSNDFINTAGIISQITLPYGINISKSNSEVYITDAVDYVTGGKVFVFDLLGNFKYPINVSNTPSKIIPRDKSIKYIITNQ